MATATHPQEPWLTCSEAADLCSVSVWLIRQWARQGLIRKRQTTGHRRYDRADVEAIAAKSDELLPTPSNSANSAK